MLAWKIAQSQRTPVVAAAAGCLVVMVIDLTVLLGFGLLGALFQHEDGRSVAILCGSGLLGLAASAMVIWFLPEGGRAWRDPGPSQRSSAASEATTPAAARAGVISVSPAAP